MPINKLTSLEQRAVISISSIMALRMIGLFMVLPVFTLYAQHLNYSTPTLVGLSMGIYGLSQAMLQIPFGALSDRVGRKPIIILGLILFISGSLIAANARNIYVMLAGRVLQGAGAIGSTLLALMADLTRESERTKCMAISGITIGFSFALAMVLGPLLAHWTSVSGIFWLAGLMGLCAIGICIFYTPTPITLKWHRDTEPEWQAVLKLLKNTHLMQLNLGILLLHAIFTATFVVIPLTMQNSGVTMSNQWHIYLPALVLGAVISFTCIGIAERKQLIKPFFITGIITLILAELMLFSLQPQIRSLILSLTLFFAGFTLLEAFLPSLISRVAPAYRKGSALGIYSCSQFFGIFLGGAGGGWLLTKFHFAGVYFFCIMAAVAWLIIAVQTQLPRYLVTQMWRISPAQQPLWQDTLTTLQTLPGMVEVTFIPEEGIAYLKMERATAKTSDYLRLKEQFITN